MTAKWELKATPRRLTCVQQRQCVSIPRSPTIGDVEHRVREYAAGYTDAQADNVRDN